MTKLSKPQAELARQLGPLEGKRISGGCDTCDAYQTAEPLEAGGWKIVVHHDEWCPRLAKIKGQHR